MTEYFYSGSEVISEKQGSTWTDHIFFGDQRIAKQTGSTVFTATFFHMDHLGSVRRCTNGSGDSNGACDYEPFGEAQPGSTCADLPTNYRFAGMEWDSDAGSAGLYKTWFRYYDHNQGRWMGVDPVAGSAEEPQTLNRYAYVGNDPVNRTDPLGLWWYCEVWVLTATILDAQGGTYDIPGSDHCHWIWINLAVGDPALGLPPDPFIEELRKIAKQPDCAKLFGITDVDKLINSWALRDVNNAAWKPNPDRREEELKKVPLLNGVGPQRELMTAATFAGRVFDPQYPVIAQWDQKPFYTLVGKTFANLAPPQQYTVAIHELLHAAFPTRPRAITETSEYNDLIARRCKTGLVPTGAGVN